MVIFLIMIVNCFLVPLYCFAPRTNYMRMMVPTMHTGFGTVDSVFPEIKTKISPEKCNIISQFKIREHKRSQSQKEQNNTTENIDFKPDNIFSKDFKFIDEKQRSKLSNINNDLKKNEDENNLINKKLHTDISSSNDNLFKRVKESLSDIEEDQNKNINKIDILPSKAERQERDSIQQHLPSPILSVPSNKQNKPTTESDNSNKASVTYNFGNSLYLLYIDLDEFSELFSDVLFFYMIQFKFLNLFGCYKSFVKIPRIFIPKTLEDLITLYIYTELVLKRYHFKQVMKIHHLGNEERKKMEADKRKSSIQQKTISAKNGPDHVKAQKQDSIPKDKPQKNSMDIIASFYCMPELKYLKTVCSNVYNTLQNNHFPNNKIPDLINQQSYDNLYSCLFDILNANDINHDNINKAAFLNTERTFFNKKMEPIATKINFSVSQKGFTEILERFSEEFKKKFQSVKFPHLTRRAACRICLAIENPKKIKTNSDSSDDSEQNIFLKNVKKIFTFTKKPDITSSYKKIGTYSNDEIIFVAYHEGFKAMFNVPIDHSVLQTYLWEFFDFLYIKRRLFEMIYIWDQNIKDLLPPDTEDYKKMGDIYFLYYKHMEYLTKEIIDILKYVKENYKFTNFERDSVFYEYFKNYINSSPNKDIYDSLYKADTQAKEIKVLVDYLNKLSTSQEDKLKNYLLCSYCSLDSKIQIYVTPEALEKTLENYEPFFDKKISKIYEEETQKVKSADSGIVGNS